LGTRNNYCIYSIIIILAAGGFCQAESRAEESQNRISGKALTGKEFAVSYELDTALTAKRRNI
jgi:hypothetical protein